MGGMLARHSLWPALGDLRARDPPAGAKSLDQAWREVRDGGDVEAVAQPVEDRKVDGLGHGAQTEDADSDAIRHGTDA